MKLYVHDTLKRDKVEFIPRDPKRVTMYVCGPTVYSYAHIGNARPVVVFDVLFRLLRELYGPDHVVYARNITDVDDKINKAAMDQGVGIEVITNKFADIYNEDMATLGALRPTMEPRVTANMDAILRQIGDIVANGHAYAAEGHVLFDVASFAGYGRLSKRSLDDMIAGARVEVAPYKKNAQDFVLWKPSKPGEPVWESPWGPGRPGWHIECSAMIEANLGLPIDIHGGGHDLIFPHHENEIAQGVCAHSHGESEYARYWMHNGFLDFGKEKMSKSLGNVKLVHDLVKEHPGEVLRLALLSAHYRAPLDWTPELLEQSRASLDRLYGTLQRASSVEPEAMGDPAQLLHSLLDDLNTPGALSSLFGLARELDKAVAADSTAAKSIKGDLLFVADILGILQQDPEAWFKGGASDDLSARVEALLIERTAARTAKNWPEADRIRKALDELGVEVMDSAQGPTWKMKASV